MFFGLATEVVEHHAGLDAREPPPGVDLENPVEVFRAIEHDRHVAALTREARSRPAGEDRRAVLAADLERREHVVTVPGDHDSDRHVAVVGGVRRVERAAAGVEADLATNRPGELVREGRRGGIFVSRRSRDSSRPAGQ